MSSLRFAKPAPPKSTRPPSASVSASSDSPTSSKIETKKQIEQLTIETTSQSSPTISKPPIKPLPSPPISPSTSKSEQQQQIEQQTIETTSQTSPIVSKPPSKPPPATPESNLIASQSPKPRKPTLPPKPIISDLKVTSTTSTTTIESKPITKQFPSASVDYSSESDIPSIRSFSKISATQASSDDIRVYREKNQSSITTEKPKLPSKSPELMKLSSTGSITDEKPSSSLVLPSSKTLSTDNTQSKPKQPIRTNANDYQTSSSSSELNDIKNHLKGVPIRSFPSVQLPGPLPPAPSESSPTNFNRQSIITDKKPTTTIVSDIKLSKPSKLGIKLGKLGDSISESDLINSASITTDLRLHIACENGNLEFVQECIRNQIDLNATDDKARSPLHYACKTGQFEIIKLLVENNVNIACLDSKRNTPESIAKSLGFNEIGSYLAIENFKRLKQDELDLSNYAIQGLFQFDSIFAFNSLKSLNLSGNLLSDLPNDILNKLTSLTNLDISHNKFIELNVSISKLSELRSLDISNNQLDLLPAELGCLPNLKKFNWKNNPLRFIPSTVIKGGTTSLLRYLSQLKDCATEWKRMKLLVVGEENVGKTSILRCFRSKPITPNVSTNGIDIQSCQIDSRVSFTAWDFGGQEVFYPTHLFFLTGRSIYLVVFNLLHPNLPRVEYWLQQIQISTTGSHSPVVMVGTHSDECSSEKTQSILNIMKKLSRRYPNVEDVIAVGCRTQEGIQQLKNRLKEIALESTLLKKLVPGTWELIDVRLQYLREESVQTIKRLQFQSMALQCGIDKKDSDQVLQFLRDIGTVLIFNQNITGLANLIIINPQWLADIMSGIISFNHKWIRDGILLHSNLCHIWEKQSQRTCETYLNLLENFEIALPLRGDPPRSLIPCLLPESRPNDFREHWTPFPESYQSEFGRFYEFSFFPLGLFGRLLVRFLHIKGAINKCQWRNGVVIGLTSDEQQIALCEYDNVKCRLNIYVRGKRTIFPNLLRLIIDEIDTLIETVYDIRSDMIRIYIPCLHCRTKKTLQEPYLFTTDDCLKAIATNQPFVYCHGIVSPTRAVQVNLLAPDIAFQELKVLDRVEILEQIGKGGFGVIYKGNYCGRTVAIKELKLDEDIDENELADKYKEFRFEVHTMSLLEHPNIVKFYGLTLHPFRMIMEFIPNGDLFHFLHKSTTNLSWRMTLKICLDIAKGLHYMHSISPPIIHRDIRSPNILVNSFLETAPEIVKIADFGLARTVAPTAAGTIGTWQWAAPEVLDSTNKYYDEKADIYSMGIVFWEVASKSDPFDEYRETQEYGKYMGKDDQQHDIWLFRLQEIKQAIIRQRLRPTIPPTTNNKLKELIESCWQTNPKDRPTAKQVVEILSKLLGIDPKENLKINYSPNIALPKKLPTVQPLTMPRGNSSLTLSGSILCEPILIQSKDIRPLCLHYCLGHVWIGCRDGLLSIWNVEKQRRVQDLILHSNPINDIVSNQTRLFVSSDSGIIDAWDPISLSVLQQIKAHGQDQVIKCLLLVCHISTDFKIMTRLWSFSPTERQIHIWNIDNMSKVSTINTGQHFPINSAVYVVNSNTVWAGTHRSILVIDPENLQIIGVLEGHLMRINSMTFTQDDVWSGSDDGDICIWNRESGEFVKRLKVHTASVKALVKSNEYIFSCSLDQQIIVSNYQHQPLQEILSPTDELNCMTVTPTSVWAASDKCLVICNFVSNQSSIK